MAGILEGKVALVTGGGSGIGRATAVIMAREGARVAVSDLSKDGIEATVGLINAGGGQGIAIAGDVTSETDVANMVARTVSAYGRLDCAYNNAGISSRADSPAGTRLHEVTQTGAARMFSVNLMGVFLCLKHEIAQMLKQGGGGAIVNTSSIAGLVGLPTSSHYVAAKHGVVGLTKTAALEYAQDGIRVNCVNPGYIKTPMTDDIMKIPLRGDHGQGADASPRQRGGNRRSGGLDVLGQGIVHDRRLACGRRRIFRGLTVDQVKLAPELAMHGHDRAVDVADQAVAEHHVGDFPVAAAAHMRQRRKRDHARGLAARLAAQRLVGDRAVSSDLGSCGCRHAGGIRPTRLAMILSTMRFGSHCVIRCRIGSGAIM